MKQTAVEWLISKLFMFDDLPSLVKEEVEKAKEMERQQIIDAVDGYPLDKRDLDGEQYYNETFKSE